MATPLSDAEFLDKFIELGKSQTRMAEHCGNSRQAVAKRLRRLQALAVDTSEDEKSSGKTAVIIHAEMAHHVTKNFDDGVQNTINEMKSLAKLGDILRHIEENLEFITEELKLTSAATGKRKMQPHLVKLMITLAREARGIITDSFQIKKDLFQLKGVASFMEAMIQVHLKYDPDIRRKLFVELSRLGTGEQVFGLDEEQGP